jgi:hypothetical protein
MRPALLAAVALLATPAAAQSDLSLVEIGTAFCAVVVAGATADLAPLLTPELAALTAGADVRWSSGTTPTACMPVGATGSAEHPESVLFLTYADGSTGSDKLVLSFIDGNIRIDDVVFADGTTLRESLASQ